MSYEIVLPIWNALRDRFQKSVSEIPEENLNMQLGETTVADLLYHTAEVEYMFTEWFFNKAKEKELVRPTTIEGFVELLEGSNNHFLRAMQELPEDTWNEVQKSAFGDSTPLEAVGRLMNHAGIHNGQISYIQKHGNLKSK